MGIQGLEMFVEKKCPQVLEQVDIAVCAREYRQRTGKTPVLLVHGFSSNILMQYTLPPVASDGIYLGQYKVFEEVLKNLVQYCIDNGIQCKFFLGGPISHNLEEKWCQTRENDLQKMYRCLDFLRKKQFELVKPEMAFFSTKGVHMSHYLRKLGNNCFIQCMGTSEGEIARYIAEEGLFGILAQDSDFLITEGIENYFSALFLNPETFTTRAYRRKALATYLGIDEAYLPLFAALCRKRYDSCELLRKFHLSLLNKRNIRVSRNAASLPGIAIIDAVAQWMKKNATGFAGIEEASLMAARQIGYNNLGITEFIQKVNDFRPSTLDFSIEEENQFTGDWFIIINLAKNRHKYHGVNRNVLAILMRLKCFEGCAVEIFSDETFPSSGILLKQIRRKLYGILLKERPKCLGDPHVKEFVLCKPDSLSSPPSITPEFPPTDLHPGLLNLWGYCSMEDKLKLLCWAISPQLDVAAAMEIPQNLRVPSLALFYLVNEVTTGMARWQIEALVVHIIRLAETPAEDLRNLIMEKPSPTALEVHFSSIYKSTWSLILAVDDACGNPLFNGADDIVYFDGKLFHNVYHAMPRSANGDQMNDSPNYNSIIKFVYRAN